jgi:hypothetical protein
MATRVNILRLIQQARGLADLVNRRPQAAAANPLLLQLRPPRWKSNLPKAKRIIRIDMQESPAIPSPVPIIHL